MIFVRTVTVCLNVVAAVLMITVELLVIIATCQIINVLSGHNVLSTTDFPLVVKWLVLTT